MEEITPVPHDPVETMVVPVTLPDNIIYYNILTRVPGKSLLRFKCVSKDWYNLTKNPSFIDLHHNHALDNPDDNEGLVICHFDWEVGSVCFCDAPPPIPNRANVTIPTIDVGIIPPFDIVGSCNGLICLASASTAGGGVVALCNPLTRECRRLTDPPNLPRKFSQSRYFYGFGYDSVSRDYKIARIVSYEDEIDRWNETRKIQVYSTSTQVWREINGVPQDMFVFDSGVFLNNKLHWIVHARILTFDLGSDEFGEIQLGTIQAKASLKLVVSGGLLYALCPASPCNSIWVMKEYGVAESWTELYASIGEDNTVIVDYTSKKGGGGGEALMRRSLFDSKYVEHELIWYNFEDKSTRIVHIAPHKYGPFCGRPWMCTASIAPIPSL